MTSSSIVAKVIDLYLYLTLVALCELCHFTVKNNNSLKIDSISISVTMIPIHFMGANHNHTRNHHRK